MERDLCGFVLSLTLHVNRPYFYEASAGHVLAAKQQQQQQLSEVAPAGGTRPPIENPDLQSVEVDRVCLDNAKACGEAQKKNVLPEMLSVEECIGRRGNCVYFVICCAASVGL